VLGILKMLKIIRVSRIGIAISNLNYSKEFKTLLKIANVLFLLVIYVHVLACILFFLFNANMVWVPPTNFMFLTSQLFNKEIAPGEYIDQIGNPKQFTDVFG
jgi:hypothetical protein